MATKMLPASKFFLFEVNEVHRPDLQRLDHPFFIGVLDDSRREVEFFGDGGIGDSYYCENTIHYDAVAPRIELTHTLDKVTEKHDVPMPDFIKLDTQGAELDILRGGSRAPAHAKLVFLERPILAYNAGAPGIQDYHNFFDLNGFYPLDICEKHDFAGSLVQADFLFIRKELVPTGKRFKAVSNAAARHR